MENLPIKNNNRIYFQVPETKIKKDTILIETQNIGPAYLTFYCFMASQKEKVYYFQYYRTLDHLIPYQINLLVQENVVFFKGKSGLEPIQTLPADYKLNYAFNPELSHKQIERNIPFIKTKYSLGRAFHEWKEDTITSEGPFKGLKISICQIRTKEGIICRFIPGPQGYEYSVSSLNKKLSLAVFAHPVHYQSIKNGVVTNSILHQNPVYHHEANCELLFLPHLGQFPTIIENKYAYRPKKLKISLATENINRPAEPIPLPSENANHIDKLLEDDKLLEEICDLSEPKLEEQEIDSLCLSDEIWKTVGEQCEITKLKEFVEEIQKKEEILVSNYKIKNYYEVLAIDDQEITVGETPFTPKFFLEPGTQKHLSSSSKYPYLKILSSKADSCLAELHMNFYLVLTVEVSLDSKENYLFKNKTKFSKLKIKTEINKNGDPVPLLSFSEMESSDYRYHIPHGNGAYFEGPLNEEGFFEKGTLYSSSNSFVFKTSLIHYKDEESMVFEFLDNETMGKNGENKIIENGQEIKSLLLKAQEEGTAFSIHPKGRFELIQFYLKASNRRMELNYLTAILNDLKNQIHETQIEMYRGIWKCYFAQYQCLVEAESHDLDEKRRLIEYTLKFLSRSAELGNYQAMYEFVCLVEYFLKNFPEKFIDTNTSETQLFYICRLAVEENELKSTQLLERKFGCNKEDIRITKLLYVCFMERKDIENAQRYKKKMEQMMLEEYNESARLKAKEIKLVIGKKK